MIKLWKLLSVSIVLAVCLGLLLVPAAMGVPVSAAPGEPASGKVAFQMPEEVYVLPGETFSVNVTIYNPHQVNMSIATAAIRWDDAGLLNVTDVTPGEWPVEVDRWPVPISDAVDNFTYDGGGSPSDPSRNTTITHCTVNFTAATTSGVTTVRFVADGGEYGDVSSVVYDTSPTPQDVLDWAAMQNMTVKIGTPRLTVNPTSLSFTATEGANPPGQTLEVCSSGVGTLDWSLTDNAAWLSETPTSGSLGADACEDVTVSVDVAGMEVGDYSATITIIGSAEVAVNLHIESAMPEVPVAPANLSASSLSISPHQVNPGEEVTISINVANTGGETGSYNAVLYINGAVEDSQSVSVAPGMTENVIFTVSKSQAGVYDVLIAEQSGQFEVVSAGWFGGGLNTSGIVAIVLIVIAIILALVFILRRTRRAV